MCFSEVGSEPSITAGTMRGQCHHPCHPLRGFGDIRDHPPCRMPSEKAGSWMAFLRKFSMDLSKAARWGMHCTPGGNTGRGLGGTRGNWGVPRERSRCGKEFGVFILGELGCPYGEGITASTEEELGCPRRDGIVGGPHTFHLPTFYWGSHIGNKLGPLVSPVSPAPGITYRHVGRGWQRWCWAQRVGLVAPGPAGLRLRGRGCSPWPHRSLQGDGDIAGGTGDTTGWGNR